MRFANSGYRPFLRSVILTFQFLSSLFWPPAFAQGGYRKGLFYDHVTFHVTS
jgi:hypothetical protein